MDFMKIDCTSGFWCGFSLLLLVLLAAALVFGVVSGLRLRKQSALIRRYKEESRRNEQEKMVGACESSDSYARFFPGEILEKVMQKQPDGELLFTQNRMKTVHMFMNSNTFLEMIRAMAGEEIFGFLNRMTAGTLPLIYQSGGIVERFEEAGLNVYFEKQDKEALVCAISICSYLEELREREKNEHYDSYTIGICLDPTMIGVAGDKNRASIMSYSSEAPGFVNWLQRRARDYYSKIIVTGEYLDRLEDVKKQFHVRKLGNVWLKGIQKMQVLYDVYDGDPAEIRDRKRQTKMLFEEGVRLYAEGKLEDARRHFVEVLKADGNDMAARRYIRLCEKDEESLQAADGIYCVEVF